MPSRSLSSFSWGKYIKTNKLVKLVNSFTVCQAQLNNRIVRLSDCEALESERTARNGRPT